MVFQARIRWKWRKIGYEKNQFQFFGNTIFIAVDFTLLHGFYRKMNNSYHTYKNRILYFSKISASIIRYCKISKLTAKLQDWPKKSTEEFPVFRKISKNFPVKKQSVADKNRLWICLTARPLVTLIWAKNWAWIGYELSIWDNLNVADIFALITSWISQNDYLCSANLRKKVSCDQCHYAECSFYCQYWFTVRLKYSVSME